VNSGAQQHKEQHPPIAIDVQELFVSALAVASNDSHLMTDRLKLRRNFRVRGENIFHVGFDPSAP